jgi:hypothetical protein
MANITFEKANKETNNSFYENTKQGAIPKIKPLICPNHKKSHVHISIGASGNLWSFKIIHACCPEFEELVKKAVYPLAE